MAHIFLPRYFFSALNSLFLKYIWHGWSPRLAFRALQRSKRIGGLDVHSICKYYEVTALQRILDWHYSVSTKLWVSLEKFLAGHNLFHAPRLPWQHKGLSELTSPTTTHALHLWDILNKLGQLAPSPPGRLPLVHSMGTHLLFSLLGGRLRGKVW